MVISSNEGTGNTPLAGRQAWSGISGPYSTNSYITTIVQLPAAAAGQTIQLKWRLGTDYDNYFPAVGWWVDTLGDSFPLLRLPNHLELHPSERRGHPGIARDHL